MINVGGFTSGQGAEVDLATQALRVSLRPLDYLNGGAYHLTSKSGTMAAGLAANSPIYAFRNTGTGLVIALTRLKISAWSLASGFTAGLATIDMFVARAWSVPDTSGVTDTITVNNNKLRTTQPSIAALSEIRHASTATLGAGTRTLDAQPIESLNVNVTAGTNTAFIPAPTNLFVKANGEYPLIFALNEGFVVQATVPATGTWAFAITPEWMELPSFVP